VKDSRQQIMYAVTLVASFGVGMLAGKSACAPEPAPKVKTKVVTETEPCRCDVGVVQPDVARADTVGEFERAKPASEEKSLPDAPPAPDPAARTRLLAWVRDQAVDLRGCRRPGSGQVNLTVTLDIDEEGVRSVTLNAPDDELSGDALTCLRERMQAWKAPGELIEGQKRVVFGLDI
jgi:hypothetical protein